MQVGKTHPLGSIAAILPSSAQASTLENSCNLFNLLYSTEPSGKKEKKKQQPSSVVIIT